MTTLAQWLTSEHDLAERLELIDHLCRALEEFHTHQPRTRPALDPARIEVAPERVVLKAADPHDVAGVPEYRAPETVAGAPYGPEADTWSAAVLCYEVLSGRHPFVMATPLGDIEAALDTPPAPLAAACPGLPVELAEAVMPCLERDPEWRPKDLSYLVEMLRQARQSLPPPRRRAPAKPAPRPAAAKPAAEERRAAAPPRPAPAATSSRLPLIAAAVVGLAAVLGGLWYLTRPGDAPPPVQSAARPPVPSATASPATTLAEGTPPASTAPHTPPSAAVGLVTSLAATPPAAPPTAPPAREPTEASPPPPTPRPLETPPPAAATPPPRAVTATPTPVPRPEPPRGEAAPARPEPAAPARPAVLSAVLPSRLRRGTRPLVDVRGNDLRAELRARILYKGREEAVGVKTVQQRLVNPTLLTIMLEIDTQARDGSYTLSLVDALGNVSNALPFEIGR